MNRFARSALAAAALALFSFCVVAAPGDRVALLIGNSAYPTSPLRSAATDARDLGAALKDLGFRTLVRENVTRNGMIEAIRDFGQAIEGAEVALFFYAGHGMQFKARNYLLPIDAHMSSEVDVSFYSVEISQVLDRMDRARTRFNFLILDAGRENPFAGSFKVSSPGLAQMIAPPGTMIALAAAPGAIAPEGTGRNGAYAKQILQHIGAPNLPVEVMFRRVREDVERETNGRQTPWEGSSLKGDFAFNSAARIAASAAVGMESGAVSARGSDAAKGDPGPAGTLPAAPAQAAAEPRSSDVETAGSAETARRDGIGAGVKVMAELAKDRLDALLHPERVSEAPSSQAVPAVTAMAKPQELGQGREIAPGVREIVFPDGAIYRGAVKGGVIQGRGEYISKSFRYQGEFREGLKHGRGTYVWSNGDRFEGEFADDRPHGKGRYQFSSGDRYEGEVSAGVIAGRGTYVSANGDQFEGSFSDGRPEGEGTYRFANGDRYEGDVSAGKPQGKGRYFTKSGDRIEATFVAGRPHGKGVFNYSNGDRYEGDFQNGALTGKGTYFYSTGLKYEGDVVDGQPRGRGVFSFADGSRFVGVFENGLAKATGELLRSDGSRAPAEIVDGGARLIQAQAVAPESAPSEPQTPAAAVPKANPTPAEEAANRVAAPSWSGNL